MTIRPRIGYLLSCFPGPAHPSAWREVRALEEAGVEVVIYSTRPPPPGLAVHPWAAEAMARTEYLARGTPLGALPALPALPWGDLRDGERGLARELLPSLAPARALVASAARHGLRHVHVHGCGRAAAIAALAERMEGPSYSLALPGPLSEGGPGQSLKWRAARFALVATRKLLAEVKTVLRDDRPARLVVQPPGVDTTFFRRDAPYRPPRAGERLRLFACGRLGPEQEELLLALRHLLDGGTPADLVIAGADGGDGSRGRLEARLKALRLGERTRLLGAVGEERVRAELLSAHMFLQPGPREAPGPALVEAMACGVPVIGPATGGARELVTHGVDGLLVPPRDPAALARAVLFLAQSPARAMALSEAARARAEWAFDARRGADTLRRELGLGAPGEFEDGLPAWPRA